MTRATAFAMMFGAMGCTAIAGLDGDYEVGDTTPTGGPGGNGAAQSGGGPTTSGGGVSSGAGSSVGGGSANGGSSTGGSSTGGNPGTGGAGGATSAVCGNDLIESGEECDDGAGSPSPYCDDCVVVCNGTYDVKNPTNFHCYYDTVIDGMHNSWQVGRTWCQNNWDGELAVMSDAAEVSFIQGLAPNVYNEDRWLGGNDLASEATYVWVTGEPWTFMDGQAPWASNEPGPTQNEDCIVLRANGELAEVGCDQGVTHQMCERAPIGN